MIAVQDSIALEEAAIALASDIHAVYPSMTAQILVHRRGQRQDALQKALSRLSAHPGIDAARELLKSRNSSGEHSAFLGVAVGHERTFFNRRGKTSCLGFITLNIDQYESREQALYGLYSLTSQFLDMTGAITPKSLEEHGDVLLPPKRALLSQARSNLKADIFGALMMETQGVGNSVRELAQIRSMQSLQCQISQQPEAYPFAISVDVAEFAAKKVKSLSPHGLLRSLNQLALDVTKTFDKQNIESWVNFTNPAQAMAWSGCTPEQILGAAIHTSPNPFIKSIGNLLAEVTALHPATKEAIRTEHNPFVDFEINQIAHERQVEDTFEMVMIHSMEADSSLPLIHVANNQNETLLKGKMLGWCSHALQSAAKAYDNARVRGAPAMQAARLEFESAKHQTNWDSLNRLNEHIVDQRRQGVAITLSDVAAWCKTNLELRPVMESINYTLTDPGYMRKLEAANEMPTPDLSLAPQTVHAAPSMAPSMQPSLGMGMGMGRGMGGGMNTASRPPVKKGTTQSEE